MVLQRAAAEHSTRGTRPKYGVAFFVALIIYQWFHPVLPGAAFFGLFQLWVGIELITQIKMKIRQHLQTDSIETNHSVY